MKQLAEKIIVKLIQDYIKDNKYLNDPKYFKNNYWSWAAWDSLAARGQVGGCGICNNNFYNATLKNKRVCTKKGQKGNKYTVEISGNLCRDCVMRIQKELNVEFKRN